MARLVRDHLRVVAAGLAAALVLAVAPAQGEITGPGGRCQGLAESASLVAINVEKLTVSTTALSLTASKYAPTSGTFAGAIAVAVLISVDSNGVNATDDGTTPVAAGPGVALVSNTYWICRGSIARFQAIRTSGTDSVLNAIFYVAR